MVRSNSLRSRGSQLMRSLRKMVQRSESMEEGDGVEPRPLDDGGGGDGEMAAGKGH